MPHVRHRLNLVGEYTGDETRSLELTETDEGMVGDKLCLDR